MGFVTLGTFIAMGLVRDSGNLDAARLGLQGGMVQMISHGFISGAMFSCVGVLYDRMHTRMIRDYGGVANVMPWFAMFMVLFGMANSGLPGTSGFIGEITTMTGAYQWGTWVAFVAASGVIFSAVYALVLYKRVMFGVVTNDELKKYPDLTTREIALFVPLIAGTIALGVYPAFVFDFTTTSIDALVAGYRAAIGG
jgi:NADH-quinone oxidoreductase subunit M